MALTIRGNRKNLVEMTRVPIVVRATERKRYLPHTNPPYYATTVRVPEI